MRKRLHAEIPGIILAACVAFMLIVSFSLQALAFQGETGRASPKNQWSGAKPKYVFLFVGDGLGLQQISAAEAYLAAMNPQLAETSGKPGIVKLSFARFDNQGLCTTYSANSFITDSAPAGTALATGYKTDNGVIGVDPSKTRSFETIAESAKNRGMRVGIVSSVSLNHATPASFYAHQPSRNSYYEIGQQLINSRFDYFAGGGLHKHSDGGRQSLYDTAKNSGFTVLRDRKSIMAAQYGGKPVLAVNPVLDKDSAMPYALDRTGQDVTLAEFVQKGIQILDNKNGFFMMVEGGKVDWACHANDAAASIQDTLAFDESVQVALSFAQKHPAETLIVVTGDHETGGMALGFAGTEYNSFYDKIANQKASYLEFDKKIAVLRAEKGKNAALKDVRGIIENTFGLVFMDDAALSRLKAQAKTDSKARAALGMVLTKSEQRQIEEALARSMSGNKVEGDEATREFLLYGGYEPLSIQLTHILNNKAGIGWTSYAHTGIPVPVYAQGPGSELFLGYYDNTDVAWKIFSIMGLTPATPAVFTAATK